MAELDHRAFARFTLRALGRVILSGVKNPSTLLRHAHLCLRHWRRQDMSSERPFVSLKVTTNRLAVIPAEPVPSPYWGAGIQEAGDGFRVAACGPRIKYGAGSPRNDEESIYRHHVSTHNTGFTLLEVVIALTLLGILGAVLTLQLRPLLAQTRLHDATRQMVANLQYVRMKAVSQNCRLRVTFRPATPDYVVDKDEDGVWQRQLLHSHSAGVVAEAAIPLPRDVRIASVNSGGDVIFLPRGVVDGGISITLGAVSGGETRRVVVNLAGRVRVE